MPGSRGWKVGKGQHSSCGALVSIPNRVVKVGNFHQALDYRVLDNSARKIDSPARGFYFETSHLGARPQRFDPLLEHVTHYEITPAQKRFLRKKFAREHDEETGCDCPGDCQVATCTGFVRNCRCDERSILTSLEDEIEAKKRLDAQEPRF